MKTTTPKPQQRSAAVGPGSADLAPAVARQTPAGAPGIASQLDNARNLGHRFAHTDVYPRPAPGSSTFQAAPVVQRGAAGTHATGLPHSLRAGIENLSGIPLDDVRVHYNSARPASLEALAYTQGAEIHVGPSQERYLPHETWHVVQQKQGRVKTTRQLKGRGLNDSAALEHEADAMGDKAVGHARPAVRPHPAFSEVSPGTGVSEPTGAARPAPIQLQDGKKKGTETGKGVKRAREESDNEDASNDIMELDNSDVSEEEDSSDEDWLPGGGSQRAAIDPRTIPINLKQVVDPATFAKETTWSNSWGVEARTVQHGDGAVTTTDLSGMGALPLGSTAKRAPLEGKVKLYSHKKGAGGGRKHNPNDTHSTHTAGMAMLGIPSEIGLGTGHDASAEYNRKYFPTEQEIRAKSGREWKSHSEVETEELEAPERVAAIMKQPGLSPRLTKERLLKRLKAFFRKNPETKAIKRASIAYESHRGERIDSGDLGRDVWKGPKAKWFTEDYDPEESSSDEDVRKGTAAGIRGRDSGEGTSRQKLHPSKRQKTAQ